MKTLCICTALACSSIIPAAAVRAQSDGSQHATVETKAVNAMCPIGKEPIVPSAGTVQYKGNTIGLCCPGCGNQFLAWDDARKNAFVANQLFEPSKSLEFGSVRQYGQMKEVMRQGATQPRIALSEFTGNSSVVAVGALDGLAGEIVIVDGDVWVSRPSGANITTTQATSEHATLLTVAEVDVWSSTKVDAKSMKIDQFFLPATDSPTPFIIEANTAELSLHVVNGYCPVNSDPAELGTEPWRWSGTVSNGVTIVGIHAPKSAGILTHHGTSFHAHALIELDGKRVAAHIDDATILGSALLRTPQSGNENAVSIPDDTQAVNAEDEIAIHQQLMHYPINTCIVMGAELGSMGDPINIIHNGRLVRLCCEGCIDTLNEDPKKVMADLDAAIVDAQLDSYPLDTCVISGAKLGSMGKPINVFHENRLAQLCCAGCLDAFNAHPAAAMSKVDTAYANAQRDTYRLDTCIVSGAKLGSMGEPIELVAGTQLIRFCCAGCLPRFRAEPQKYLSKLSQD